MKGKRWIIVMGLMLVLLFGCGGGETETSRPACTDLSPAGYCMNIEQSVYEHGLYLSDKTIIGKENILGMLGEWLDGQIEKWVLSHPEIEADKLRGVASDQVYILLDHCFFKCDKSDDPDEADKPWYGLCHGMYSYPINVVSLAIYNKNLSDFDQFDKLNSPPHLNFSGAEVAAFAGFDFWAKWEYIQGYIRPSTQTGISSLAHELDHALNHSGI